MAVYLASHVFGDCEALKHEERSTAGGSAFRTRIHEQSRLLLPTTITIMEAQLRPDADLIEGLMVYLAPSPRKVSGRYETTMREFELAKVDAFDMYDENVEIN